MAVVFELCDQDIACRRVLSAVVSLAMQDCFLRPLGNGRDLRIHNEAVSAMQFLFIHGDFFLELLDYDPEVFRKRLLARMYSTGDDVKFSGEQRRAFRWNYGQFTKLHSLGMTTTN